MKKVISLLMSFVMLFSVISSVNLSAYAEESATSGKCGDNVYWSYDLTTNTLTISGTGAMYNYNSSGAHWYGYRKNILTVKIETGVTTIGDYAFNGCSSLTSVTIPDSVTTIGEAAFESCDSLTSVTIPNSVTTIGVEAFFYCSSLTSVTIPDSVTTIGKRAFQGCSSLTSVTIPNSVTIIEAAAFYSCSSLTSVTIPNSVISIGDDAFHVCSRLRSISVASGNLNYSSKDGVLFDKNKSKLIQYPAGNQRTEYTIPNSVTTIGNSAFSFCRSLTSVTIGNSVTIIGYAAFWACDRLTSVTIGNSVTTIGDHTFAGCSSLTSVTIPDSVTIIGNWAFYRCSSLKDVYYSGSEEQWKKILIEYDNDYLKNAKIHYNSYRDTDRDTDGLKTKSDETSFIIYNSEALFECDKIAIGKIDDIKLKLNNVNVNYGSVTKDFDKEIILKKNDILYLAIRIIINTLFRLSFQMIRNIITKKAIMFI